MQVVPGCVILMLITEGGTHMGSSSGMTYMWEEDNMRLQKRNGYVPGIVGFA